MRRVIVDYKKLTPEVFRLLNEMYPDGYGDDDIITFDDHHNQTIEAVEVRTDEAIYLVKISCKLHYSMVNFNNQSFQLNDLGNIIFDEEE